MLNSRQIEVLKMVADGLSYKEVGARLHLSPRTIKYHMAEIMNRLHLENRAQVLAYTGQMGWMLKNQQLNIFASALSVRTVSAVSPRTVSFF